MTTPLDELDIRLDVNSVTNLAQITVYPVETVGTAQVVWTAQTVLRLAPGQTRVVYAPFHDENGERTGAVDVVTPVASTDYAVNEKPDGTGFNYTNSPSFSISTEIEATRAKITLGNSAIGPLYMTLLQVRGKPLRTYDPVTVEESDAASQAAYDIRALALDLPMQDDPVFALSYAQYVIGRFKTPALAADRLTVRNRDVISAVNVFSLELLDKVVISDTATGASRLQHWIRAIATDLAPGALAVTLYLERADDRQYWLLGKAGFGALDSQTRLGF